MAGMLTPYPAPSSYYAAGAAAARASTSSGGVGSADGGEEGEEGAEAEDDAPLGEEGPAALAASLAAVMGLPLAEEDAAFLSGPPPPAGGAGAQGGAGSGSGIHSDGDGGADSDEDAAAAKGGGGGGATAAPPPRAARVFNAGLQCLTPCANAAAAAKAIYKMIQEGQVRQRDRGTLLLGRAQRVLSRSMLRVLAQ